MDTSEGSQKRGRTATVMTEQEIKEARSNRNWVRLTHRQHLYDVGCEQLGRGMAIIKHFESIREPGVLAPSRRKELQEQENRIKRAQEKLAAVDLKKADLQVKAKERAEKKMASKSRTVAKGAKVSTTATADWLTGGYPKASAVKHVTAKAAGMAMDTDIKAAFMAGAGSSSSKETTDPTVIAKMIEDGKLDKETGNMMIAKLWAKTMGVQEYNMAKDDSHDDCPMCGSVTMKVPHGVYCPKCKWSMFPEGSGSN